jgi:arabinogalactan endo-1,4-beta-galactosidase
MFEEFCKTRIKRLSDYVARLLLAGLMAAVGMTWSQTAQATGADFYTGSDLSLLPYMESLGQTFTDGWQAEPVLTTIKNHGSNIVRVRLWVNPSKTDIQVNDLAYTVALGQRVKRAGLALLLDIHYSDTWADAGRQDKPAAWYSLNDEQLKAQVKSYTASVITTMRQAGAMPDIVQIGNETTDGMLWPSGRISVSGWKAYGDLIKAGVRGVREGRGDACMPKIMVHIDRGGDWGAVQWYYDNLTAQQVDYDIIGLSYYPYYHGSLDVAKTVLTNTATRYSKRVMVVETGYPFEGTWSGDWITHPITPAGQRQFLIDLVTHVRNLPQGRGLGVVFWAPEWIWVSGQTSSWGWKTLYDDGGVALPGMAAIGGLLDPSRYYRIVNRLSGKALQVVDDNTSDAAIVQQWDLLAGAGTATRVQQWSFTGNADGYFTLKARKGGKILGTTSYTDGAQVLVGTSAGATSQQWDFVDVGAGYFKIVNRQSGEALDNNGASNNGSWLFQWPSGGGWQQQWSIVPVN